MIHNINEKYMLTPENIIKFLPSKINTKKDIRQPNKEECRPKMNNNIDPHLEICAVDNEAIR